MTQNAQATYAALDAWIDQHFDEQVRFLQALVQVPTDTPPGNNAPHAERTAELIKPFGFEAEKHVVPEQDVKDYGMQSITNLIVRRPYGDGGRTIALNAHGDVVPPGEGWTEEPYAATIKDGKMAHAAVPHTGVDALQAATAVLNALYGENVKYKQVTSKVAGIKHPYVNVGRIEGGTNTNVIPGKVTLKVDRRMIPEENPAEVEATIRAVMTDAIAAFNTLHGYTGEDAVRIDIKRLLLANAMTPLAGNKPLVDAIQTHGEAVFGEKPPAVGTPLYTDVRLYVERGIPGVIYGAGPRSVLESHAKRADERVELEDLRRATKVIARSLHDLLA